jgi:DNA polymerase III epsilon subunit family exonuclease
MDYKSIVFFDLETTGLDPKEDRIIEIGFLEVDFKTLEVVNELNLLINQDVEISEKITEITGITKKMLEENGVGEFEMFTKIQDFIKDESLLVAYNTQFDINFIMELYRKIKQDKDFVITNDMLDIMAVYRDRHGYPHRLQNAIEMYNVDLENTHRALDDIKATFEVFKAMSKETKNVAFYINKFGYLAKYGVSYEKLPQVEYIAQGYNGINYIIEKIKEQKRGKLHETRR